MIDQEELSSLLDKHMTIGIFTPTDIRNIIKDIDLDDNGTLDFKEVLTVGVQATRKALSTCHVILH